MFLFNEENDSLFVPCFAGAARCSIGNCKDDTPWQSIDFYKFSEIRASVDAHRSYYPSDNGGWQSNGSNGRGCGCIAVIVIGAAALWAIWKWLL